MDMREHNETWDGFWIWTKWGTLLTFGLVAFLVLLLILDLGFLASFFLVALGIVFLGYMF